MSAHHRIRTGDRISLHYRIASYGREIVNTFPDMPETFRLGGGDIDPRLEKALFGLTEGDHRMLELPPQDAFGLRDEALVQTLPRDSLPADLAAGRQVEFELPEGRILLGTVIEIDKTAVRVDFNHPLAGLPVEFEVQILSIEHDS